LAGFLSAERRNENTGDFEAETNEGRYNEIAVQAANLHLHGRSTRKEKNRMEFCNRL